MNSGNSSNFGDAIRRRLEIDPTLREQVDQESFNLDVATMIYDARTAAGLTQAELAERIGTSQSVIARLESADYDGHSLRILRRIATALNLRLQLSFENPRPTA